MTPKNISGKIGEEYASKHLAQNGYKIICRNYKVRSSEIDIIASDGDCLCFIEVKTRKNKNFGMASEAVDFRKREKLILGARCFLSSKPPFTKFRFDVVEVYGNVCESGFLLQEINIIKNAFEA